MERTCSHCSFVGDSVLFRAGRNECLRCQRNRQRQWERDNNDKIVAAKRTKRQSKRRLTSLYDAHVRRYYAHLNKKRGDMRWRTRNADKKKENDRKWRTTNKERVQENRRKYRRKVLRGEAGPLALLKLRIRALIMSSLAYGGFTKKARTYALLGCSYDVFLEHVGPRPSPEHVLDHICPCAQACGVEEDLLKLQHYTNFRWLPSTDNCTKSNKWTPEGEALCEKLLGRPWKEKG
jgi:hypothetical protein